MSKRMDLSKHDANCDLHKLNRTMCSAEATRPDRQTIFQCMCAPPAPEPTQGISFEQEWEAFSLGRDWEAIQKHPQAKEYARRWWNAAIVLAPAPDTDKLRELVAKWREFADTDHSKGMKLSDARKQAQHELMMAGQSLAYATAANQLEAALSPRGEGQTRPKIICLCGSTRFTVEMAAKSWELAKKGIIALGWNILLDGAAFPNGAESHGAEAEGIKEQIDELHKRKIDLADEVFVLNIGGYIGESTRSEINYALAHNKPVLYAERAAQPPADAKEG
jgi:hypothetical protein